MLSFRGGAFLSVSRNIRKVVTQKPRVPILPIAGITISLSHTSPRECWRWLSTRELGKQAHCGRNGAMPRSNELKKLIPDFVAGLMRTAVVLWQKEEQSIQFEEFHKRFSILVAA